MTLQTSNENHAKYPSIKTTASDLVVGFIQDQIVHRNFFVTVERIFKNLMMPSDMEFTRLKYFECNTPNLTKS